MKVKGISLIGVSVYALAKERTGDVVRGGKLNFGVVVKEGWEEWRDRWRGLDENCEFFLHFSVLDYWILRSGERGWVSGEGMRKDRG
jgi:hypothetical protein